MRTVMKIGGSTLKDADDFKRVAEIVKAKRDKEEVVLVLSAVYGVTDSLIEAIEYCRKDEGKIKEFLEKTRQRHLEILGKIDNKKIVGEITAEIDKKLKLLERFFYGIFYLKEITSRSKDMIQSFGERLSPVVLKAFLENEGLGAEVFDSEKAGIVCIGDYEKCIASNKETGQNLRKNVEPALKNKVVLITGYYGIDSEGNVKTFGRGGTDYSAGLAANCLGAELEIWKDVSGFMTANPKMVKDARKIERLSYDEAEELGYLGAEILHPKTIAPIKEKGIEAEIKDLYNPGVKGTIICKDSGKSNQVMKSVAMKPNTAIVNIGGAEMVNSPGFAARLFSIVGSTGAIVDLISTSEAAISFSIDRQDLEKTLSALKELEKDSLVEEICSMDDVVLIGVVGEGMQETPGVAGKLFSALGKQGINIELITQGASEINITFVVKEKDAEKAIQTIHGEFIEGGK